MEKIISKIEKHCTTNLQELKKNQDQIAQKIKDLNDVLEKIKLENYEIPLDILKNCINEDEINNLNNLNNINPFLLMNKSFISKKIIFKNLYESVSYTANVKFVRYNSTNKTVFDSLRTVSKAIFKNKKNNISSVIEEDEEILQTLISGDEQPVWNNYYTIDGHIYWGDSIKFYENVFTGCLSNFKDNSESLLSLPKIMFVFEGEKIPKPYQYFKTVSKETALYWIMDEPTFEPLFEKDDNDDNNDEKDAENSKDDNNDEKDAENSKDDNNDENSEDEDSNNEKNSEDEDDENSEDEDSNNEDEDSNNENSEDEDSNNEKNSEDEDDSDEDDFELKPLFDKQDEIKLYKCFKIAKKEVSDILESQHYALYNRLQLYYKHIISKKKLIKNIIIICKK